LITIQIRRALFDGTAHRRPRLAETCHFDGVLPETALAVDHWPRSQDARVRRTRVSREREDDRPIAMQIANARHAVLEEHRQRPRVCMDVRIDQAWDHRPATGVNGRRATAVGAVAYDDAGVADDKNGGRQRLG
jgi:hypothetical protein